MNTIKYIVKNRFIALLFAWAIVLAFCINGNPYINVFRFFCGFMGVLCGFAYLEECGKLNAQERLFLKKLSKI